MLKNFNFKMINMKIPSKIFLTQNPNDIRRKSSNFSVAKSIRWKMYPIVL